MFAFSRVTWMWHNVILVFISHSASLSASLLPSLPPHRTHLIAPHADAFVFLWSPAMTGAVDAAAKAAGLSTPEKLPFGAIFAAFMAAVSAGSKIFSIYTRSNPISKMPFIIHGAAAAAMFSVVAFYESPLVMYGAFLVFEATCGMFWPTYGSLRSKIIPEDNRAAIANFFRVPLNAFVVILLLNTGTLSNKAMFGVTTLAHLASLTLYSIFSNESKAPKLKAK